MLKRFFRGRGLRSAQEVMQQYISFMNVAGPHELGMIYGIAGRARHLMETSSHIERKFPRAALEGKANAASEEVGLTVSWFIMETETMRKKMASSSSEAAQGMANGFLTWAVSLRAIVYPELLPEVRLIWSAFTQCRDEAEEFLWAQPQPGQTDDDVASDLWVPPLFGAH